MNKAAKCARAEQLPDAASAEMQTITRAPDIDCNQDGTLEPNNLVSMLCNQARPKVEASTPDTESGGKIASCESTWLPLTVKAEQRHVCIMLGTTLMINFVGWSTHSIV